MANWLNYTDVLNSIHGVAMHDIGNLNHPFITVFIHILAILCA